MLIENTGNTWALVLAAGEGSRLRSLTTGPCGTSIPKQFCSLRAGPALIQEALARVRTLVAPERTCAVVAAQHRCWWAGLLGGLPSNNVIQQPRNRGTAHGILLPLLHIVGRDPSARLVILPSDHHVREERVLERSLRQALEQLRCRSGETVLLGIEPERTDDELGYIVPANSDGRDVLHVQQFVEKPPPSLARELIERGALWNAFILTATASTLLDLFQRRMPQTVSAMRAAVLRDTASGGQSEAVRSLYEQLPPVDFSREILTGQEANLRVVPVPRCGWSDLGTPTRVSEALSRAPDLRGVGNAPGGGYLNLAHQFDAQRTATS